jgi:transcription termination factor Rho
VTDTQQQILLGASAPEQTSDATTAGRPAGKRKLSSMLLPELQGLASSLGINPAKLRKSELVAAIEASQGERRPVAPESSAPASAAPPSANGQPTARNGTTVRRERRSATRPVGAPVSGEATVPSSGVTVTSSDAPVTSSDATVTRREDTATGNGAMVATRVPDAPVARAREDERTEVPPSAVTGPDSASTAGAAQSRPAGGARAPQVNGADRDDDFDGGRRRGRRYRDRRGRNRDRVVAGPTSGTVEVEPTVSDDDVLAPVAGIIDAVEEKNTWFVRTEGYFASPDDVYVANSYVRRYNLRRGDAVTGAIRQPRDGERREKYNPLVRLDTVNGRDPEQSRNRIEFTKLTPLYPQERLRLETEPHVFTTRVIDLVMPIGKGQRALIVSPPKAGKTMVLQAIANAIATNNPEVHLMVVLVDERPEEVTDMQRSVKGEVIASTFDRRPQDHTMVAELSIERAKRLVEMGHDVVVLLDSITRLGRAYNLAAPASGRILSGGVDSTALYPPKRFLGAARNIENGGSLTILATALVETGSAGDTVIFEEFKGTGNAELRLRRDIADKRIWPAVDVDQSSTRKEELLLSPDELAVTIKLRRVLHALEPQQALDLLLDRLRKTRTNLEFLMQIAKTTPGQD